MSIAFVVLLSVVVVLACAQFGGGIYEYAVLDPAWPARPAIIQPKNGGVSRARFWIPAHAALEVTAIAALIVGWGQPQVRTALIVAVASHVVMRVWSLVDFIPKAVAFERTDPATIDRESATRWTRRSLWRLPLDVVTCAAALTALVIAA